VLAAFVLVNANSRQPTTDRRWLRLV